MVQSFATRYGRPVAGCLGFLWLAYMVTSGQPRFELAVFNATVRLHVLFALLAVLYAGYLIARRRLPGPTRLDLPLAAVVIAYAAATVDSIYPRVSIEFALITGAPILTFYAFHDLDFLDTEALSRLLVAAGVAAAGAALYVAGSDYVNWLRLIDAVDGGFSPANLMPPAVPRVHGVGGNVNIVAMALNLALPFAIVRALDSGFRERILAAGACLLILLAIFFTLSRGAWLGTIASLTLFGALYLLRRRDPLAILASLWRSPRLVMKIAGPVFLVGLAIAVLAATQWDSRPDWLFRASLSPRYDAMDVGFRIFRDRPVLGAGPGTYSLLYNTYSGDYPIENIHPHNGYLSVLDDAGMAGMLALLAAGVVLTLMIATALREAEPSRRLRLGACLAALASLAVHSLVDSPNTWNTALVPLAVVVALTSRLCRPAEDSAAAFQIGPRIFLAACLPLMLLAWVQLDLRHYDFSQAVADLRAGRFETAAERSAQAARVDSELAAAQMHAGVSRAILYLVQAERRTRTPDPVLLEEAKGYIYAAIAHDRRSAIAHANLAMVLRLQAEASGKEAFKHDAVEAARFALFLAPRDGTVAAAAGTVLEWAGVMDAARFAYGRAAQYEPSLVQSPLWATTPRRTEMRTPALLGSEITACEWGRASAIYAGYRDDLVNLALNCREEVTARPADAKARASLAIILQAQGLSDEARREAEEAASRVPDNPFVLTALGIVKGAAGDLTGARRELARASSLRDPYDPDAALILASTYQPGPAGTGVLRNLGIRPEPADLPAAVLDRLRVAYEHAAPFVFDDGRQRYPLGILYYRARFLRESPSSILIPGEWLFMSSPRALLIEEALGKRDK